MSLLVDDLLDQFDDNNKRKLVAMLAPLLPTANPSEDRWMSTKEAAEYLGVSIHAVHRMKAAREIPCSQDGPGCRCWFRRSELDQWLASKC